MIAVGHEENVARVIQHGRDVARHEVFVLSQADDGGRAEARRNNFVRVARRNDRQRVHAVQLPHGLAHGLFERAAIRVFLDEVRDDLRVGLRDELVAFFLQLLFQLDVVLNNSVVNDHDFARSNRGAGERSLRWGGRAWPSACGPRRRSPSIGERRRTSSRL